MAVARDELGIQRAYIPPACHQTNGVVERLNRIIAGKVRTMLSDTKLPKYPWGEAALHAIHLYNLTPHSALKRRGDQVAIPHSLYTGDPVTRLHRLYEQLMPFGHPCHVLDARDHIIKLDKRASAGTIVGVGDSILFYKVLQYVPAPRISIVRHIHVTSSHYEQYLSLVGIPHAVPTHITQTQECIRNGVHVCRCLQTP